MLKKSLIFGSVALFLAALITLTGCPTSVDDGSSGTVYAHRIYGTAVSPYQAQQAIDRAVAAGEPIVLEDRLTIVADAGIDVNALNFKNARVIINGVVTFDTGVINAVDASLEWADGARLELGAGKYIYRKGTDTSKIPDDILVEYVDSLSEIQTSSQWVAVRKYKLGFTADWDYSTGVGVNPNVENGHLTEIYVLEELIIPSEGKLPGLVITALGTVDITGSLQTGVDVGGGKLPLGTCSTLTSTTGTLNIPLVAGASGTLVPNINVQEGKPFSITAENTKDFSIPGRLTGRGTLEVRGEVVDIDIGGGDGNVWFSSETDPTVITIGSTGTVTFDEDVVVLAANPSFIAGDVMFKGNVTSTDNLRFLGNVTLVSGKILTFSTSQTLYLAPNKTIRLAITPAGASTPIVADILTAGSSGVFLAPDTATATLTAAALNKDIDLSKKLTLGTQGITIQSGTLIVAPGGTLELNAVSLTPDVTLATIGFLTLAEGGKLGFLGAGQLVIGDTTIDGVSTITAVGGDITLADNTIEGSKPGTRLEVPAKLGAAAAPLYRVTQNTQLFLKQVDLNLSSYGSLLIPAPTAGNYGAVTLKDRAKIILNSSTESGETATGTKITVGANSLALGGDYEALAVSGTSGTKKETVLSVAHNGGVGDASIIAGAAAVTLNKSGATFTK